VVEADDGILEILTMS